MTGIGALFAITVNKTVLGLRQGQDALAVLNAILMRWVGDRKVSTAHIYAWQKARDSILRNDVKNILDRYENVVVMYFLISLYLTSDATRFIVFKHLCRKCFDAASNQVFLGLAPTGRLRRVGSSAGVVSLGQGCMLGNLIT